LYNLPPLVKSTHLIKRKSNKVIALIPSWNTNGKNLAANIMAAHANSKISQIWLSSESSLPKNFLTKAKVFHGLNNEKIYNLLKVTDILLNVSVIDCQPMTNLEALAFNVPSLSGPLFLNELSRYEYTKITTVDNPLNTYEISKKIDDLLKIPINDMNEIMMNYSAGLKKIALKRYAEFLEI
jgi:glycosyltransferase involved in cell wall biosynthesis